MRGSEIREKFLEYFKSKEHAIVSSSSLMPDDPSVLLTTAGMQQFKRYYTGELDADRDFGALSVASVQKCFRTSDIDEVGDESHLTFFEMLGNFSFGGYFKREAIEYAHEFITSPDWMGLEIDSVTIFNPKEVPEDDWRKDVPLDEESRKIWESLGVKNIKSDGTDVFWGPTGSEGPCGPTTEVYVKNSSGKSLEIWNIVFNEFYCNPDKKLSKLKTPGIDTGMGLERLAMVSQDASTIFETDLFNSIDDPLKKKSVPIRESRIIRDHIRGAVFLFADGVRPSNKEAGYVLRRLIRRVLVYANQYGLSGEVLSAMIHTIIAQYGDFYKELWISKEEIIKEFDAEGDKFSKTLIRGLNELKKMTEIDARSAFGLYETFGVPYEIIKEFGGRKASVLSREEFDIEFKRHQEISKAGAEKKFGGHGLILNTGELKAGSEEELQKVLRLHTATHLLHESLRRVLGDSVAQKGSDITAERTRFDFTFSRKLTPEEIKSVENLANEIVEKDQVVSFKEMPKSDAEKTGALHFFKEKYPEKVKVYYIAPKGKGIEDAFSKEFCGGPHVTHTSEIGKIRIIKEEAVSAGVRRIRATVE